MKQELWGLRDKQVSLAGPMLREIVTELCERKQSLLLATPYLTFESRALEWAGPDLRIQATVSVNVVRHTLSRNPLRLRVPWNLTYYGGPTSVLEYEEGPKGKSLRIALPTALAPDDQRRAYRVVLAGRTPGVLATPDLDLVRINLEDISPGGIGVFCTEALPPVGFQEGRTVDISLTLEHGPALQARGRICHASGQNLGLVFQPPLEGDTLESLLAWLEPRRLEAQRHWDDRAAFWARAERAALPRNPPAGVLLVTADADLAQAVGRALAGAHPLRTVAPALAPLKDALDSQTPLVLVVAATGGMEESHRLRAMLESTPRRGPLVVLGVGQIPDGARTLAADLKATLFVDRNALNSAFFQRLVLGLIRKHWNHLEGAGGT